MMGDHVTRLQLAREFDKRFGKNIFQRIAKLSEEVEELQEASAKVRKAMSSSGSGDSAMEAWDELEDELKDVASIVNQLDYMMLNREWPDDVHEKLKKRDEDPEYGRLHPHVRNVEAGEINN